MLLLRRSRNSAESVQFLCWCVLHLGSCGISTANTRNSEDTSQLQGVLGSFSAFGMKCHSSYSVLFLFLFFFLKKKKEGEKKTSEEKLKNISEQGWAVLRVSFGNAFCSQSFSAEEALSLPRICSYVQEHMLLAADCCCLM